MSGSASFTLKSGLSAPRACSGTLSLPIAVRCNQELLAASKDLKCEFGGEHGLVALRFSVELSLPSHEVTAAAPDFWQPRPVVAHTAKPKTTSATGRTDNQAVKEPRTIRGRPTASPHSHLETQRWVSEIVELCNNSTLRAAVGVGKSDACCHIQSSTLRNATQNLGL